jgi:N-acyl-D-aspartate/D-glutamate deacylase
MLDLLVKNASIIDGLGNPPRHGDVAVADDRIVAIGSIKDPAARTVNADGRTLAPGIIDLHTHYDAQLTWDPKASPSPALGVTTIVIGNCGFGIAPCPPAMRTLMAQNLSVVEGMNLDALLGGIEWRFESFGEYLGFLRTRKTVPNVAAFVGHTPVRTAVMGAAGSERAATDDEVAAMRRLVRQSMDAGAIGFASSVGTNHIGYGGKPMPSRLADERELDSLVGVLPEVGRGVFHIGAGEGERLGMEALERIANKIRRPVVFSPVFYNPAFPERAGQRLAECAKAQARGAEIYGQVSCQPLSHDFTLDNAYLMYSLDAWKPLQTADKDTIARTLRDPAFRARYREGFKNPKKGLIFYGNWRMVDVAACARPENLRLEGRSIADLAADKGADPVDVFFDLALQEDLATVFNAKVMNSDEKAVGELIRSKAGVIAQSDAGAHLEFFCDAGFGLYMLGRWARELKAMELSEAVHRITGLPAKLYRIPGRGRIEAGAWADLILFDPARVGVSKTRRVRDLPAGGSRLVREPVGLDRVWINGTEVFDGKDYVAGRAGPGQILDKFTGP